MINEDFCSFEIAKLLEEKGFNISLNSKDWLCCMYDENGNIHWGIYDKNWYFRITHQMAMKWLRETRDIVISIFPTIETDMIVREDYNYAIYKNKTVVYQSCSTSYEEACEAAIRCCLENLI